MKTLSFFFTLYRSAISPFLGNCCRFSPSCSHYAEDAFHKKGWLRGAWLSFRRLVKCHPFHPGGFDPLD